MSELQNTITQLTSKWMNLIGPLHHKDRDCHWEITQRWSYSEKPYWVVQHYGYLEDRKQARCISYVAAQHKLIEWLTEAINNWENRTE